MASATNYQKTKIKSTAVVSGEANSIKKNPPKPTSQDWQTTAWTFYDDIGEYRYGCDWVGNVLSRVKLVIMKDGVVQTTGPAVDLLNALYDGPEGQSDMLRQIGRHWTVTGDCYIVGDNIEDEAAADWLIGASTQVTQDNTTGAWKVNTETFKSSALVIRLWRPHPTDRTVSDSPSRAVLPILSEIDGLTKYLAAQIDSRLMGNGFLLLPNGMSFGSAAPEAPATSADEDTDDPPEQPRQDAQSFVEELIRVASAAISSREDPASLIPLVIQADADQLQYIRQVTMSSDLQKQAIELRTEAVRRLALGLDMPPEVLTGTSDMNHWSSWQIEEAAIKSHLEPLLAEICSSLTDGYLRPALDSADASTYTIDADTTAIRLRPNRSKEAFELADRGKLSDEALRRENGFSEDDKPSDDEYKQWLTAKVASGSAAPEQVQAALKALGVDLQLEALPGGAGGYQDGSGTGTNETRPTPSTQDHPVTSPPEQKNPNPTPAPDTQKPTNPVVTPQNPGGQSQIAESVVFASAIMVDRALERAGNRMKSLLGGKIRDESGRDVPAAQAYRFVKVDSSGQTLDDLLSDAWMPCARWATDLSVDAGWLTDTLDSYTREVLLRGRPHTVDQLRAHLAKAA